MSHQVSPSFFKIKKNKNKNKNSIKEKSELAPKTTEQVGPESILTQQHITDINKTFYFSLICFVKII